MDKQASNQGGHSEEERRRNAEQSHGSEKGKSPNQNDTEKKRGSEDKR
jgi:hypothetical protein